MFLNLGFDSDMLKLAHLLLFSFKSLAQSKEMRSKLNPL